MGIDLANLRKYCPPAADILRRFVGLNLMLTYVIWTLSCGP